MGAAYLAGTPVNPTIALVDSDGATIAATGVEYRVIDQNEVEIVARVAASFTVGDESVTLAIPDTANALTPGNTRELRLIELYVETDAGTIKIEDFYFIEADEVLVEGVNSFQTYGNAVMVASDIPRLTGWNGATKRDRIAGLIRARQNMGALRFRYVFDEDQNVVETSVGVTDLTLATPAQWAALPADFKAAVRRAQVIEADFVLGGDEVGDIRRSGLMSMTVGEAKQFFRPGKPLDTPVCKAAMRELSKWLLTRTRITRT